MGRFLAECRLGTAFEREAAKVCAYTMLTPFASDVNHAVLGKFVAEGGSLASFDVEA